MKNLGMGKGYDVTATAKLTLSSNSKGVVSTTFYFRDNANNLVAATVSAFTPPAPGGSVTITYKPYNNPVFNMGNWTAYASFHDGIAPFNDTKVFSVP